MRGKKNPNEFSLLKYFVGYRYSQQQSQTPKVLFKEIINSHNTLGEKVNIIKHVKGEAAAVLVGRLARGVGQAGNARGEESVWTPQVVSVIPQDSPASGSASTVPPELCTTGHCQGTLSTSS